MPGMSEALKREITETTNDTVISEEIRKDGAASFSKSFGLGDDGGVKQMGEGEEFGWTGIIGMVRPSHSLLTCDAKCPRRVLSDAGFHAFRRTCPFAFRTVRNRGIQWSRHVLTALCLFIWELIEISCHLSLKVLYFYDLKFVPNPPGRPNRTSARGTVHCPPVVLGPKRVYLKYYIFSRCSFLTKNNPKRGIIPCPPRPTNLGGGTGLFGQVGFSRHPRT